MAQFCSLIRTTVDEDGEEKEETLEKQSDIEDEVCAYYEKLYRKRDTQKRRYSRRLVLN